MRRLLAIALAWGLALPAAAHEERPSEFPPPPGRVPTYRTSGPSLVVCDGVETRQRIRDLPPWLEALNRALLERCRFRSIQAAVNHVTEQGSRILILPGAYRNHRFGRDPPGPAPT